MSKCAAWLVSSFSFESKTTSPDPVLSATPKLVDGAFTQPCTRDVMSTTMNCWAIAGVNEAVAAPRAGIVANVTADSLQALVTGWTFTRPDVLIRFTYSFSVALPIWLAVVPAGRDERSNWISVVPLLLT